MFAVSGTWVFYEKIFRAMRHNAGSQFDTFAFSWTLIVCPKNFEEIFEYVMPDINKKYLYYNNDYKVFAGVFVKCANFFAKM
jgi:hypothetical protein